MKILIIGKNGQLGTELVAQSRKLNFNIVAFSRSELDIIDHQKIEIIIKKQKPDVVINASAYHVVPECEKNPEKAYLFNAIAVKRLADICEVNNIKLVHYSSDFVFDGQKGKLYIETDTPNPLQIYGITKLAGEYSVLNYCHNSIVIRTCYLYGGQTGSRVKKGNFILTILNQAKDKKELEVSSEQIVSPTYAVDLAQATLKLLKNKKSRGIYHLVNSGKCSLAELAQEIVKIKKLGTKIIPVDRGGKEGQLHRPLFSALKNNRAKKLGVILPNWKISLYKYISQDLI